jgi:hypothetical protein
LDDLSDYEKISRLEVLYPRVKLDDKLVLKFLINRDFTQSNRWTKACALHRIGSLKWKDFAIDLIAQLFNPDQLIREVAAWSLFQIDPELYHSNAKRLGLDAKSKLDLVILSDTNAELMEFEKIKFYESIDVLKEIPGITLSYLADISEEIRLKDNEVLRLDQNFNNYFYITFKGTVEYFSKGKPIRDFNSGDFIGEVITGGGYASNLLRARSETILLKIRKDNIFELLADKITLTERFLEFI